MSASATSSPNVLADVYYPCPACRALVAKQGMAKRNGEGQWVVNCPSCNVELVRPFEGVWKLAEDDPALGGIPKTMNQCSECDNWCDPSDYMCFTCRHGVTQETYAAVCLMESHHMMCWLPLGHDGDCDYVDHDTVWTNVASMDHAA